MLSNNAKSSAPDAAAPILKNTVRIVLENLEALNSAELSPGVGAAALVYGFVRAGRAHNPPNGLGVGTILDNISAIDPSFRNLEDAPLVLAETLDRLVDLKLLFKKGACYFLPTTVERSKYRHVASLRAELCGLHQSLIALSQHQQPALKNTNFPPPPSKAAAVRGVISSQVSVSSRELGLVFPRELRANPQLNKRVSRFENRIMYIDIPAISAEVSAEKLLETACCSSLSLGDDDSLVPTLVRRRVVETVAETVQRSIAGVPTRVLEGLPQAKEQRAGWQFEWNENGTSLIARADEGPVDITRVLMVGEGPKSQAIIFGFAGDLSADHLRANFFMPKIRAMRAYLGNRVGKIDFAGVLPLDTHDYHARERSETSGLGRTISKVLDNNENYYIVTNVTRADITEIAEELSTAHAASFKPLFERVRRHRAEKQAELTLSAFIDRQKGEKLLRESSTKLTARLEGIEAFMTRKEVVVSDLSSSQDWSRAHLGSTLSKLTGDRAQYEVDVVTALRPLVRIFSSFGSAGQLIAVSKVIDSIPQLTERSTLSEVIEKYKGLVGPYAFLKRLEKLFLENPPRGQQEVADGIAAVLRAG